MIQSRINKYEAAEKWGIKERRKKSVSICFDLTITRGSASIMSSTRMLLRVCNNKDGGKGLILTTDYLNKECAFIRGLSYVLVRKLMCVRSTKVIDSSKMKLGITTENSAYSYHPPQKLVLKYNRCCTSVRVTSSWTRACVADMLSQHRADMSSATKQPFFKWLSCHSWHSHNA